MTPRDVALACVDTLMAAGIRATVDPRKVVPPCVLFVPPDTVTLDRGCGGTANMTAVVLASGPAQGDSWQTLELFLPSVLEHLHAEQVRTTSYTLDDSGPMPAYELSWTALVDWNPAP